MQNMDDIRYNCEKILEFAPEGEVDEYALKLLRKRLYKWKNSKKEKLTELEYFVNGKEYKSLLKALYEEKNLRKLKIKFLKPNLEGEWNFSKPTKELMEKRGKGVACTFEFDPNSLNKWRVAKCVNKEKVMVRGYLSDFFVPISIHTKSKYHHAQEIPRQYGPKLKKLSGIWCDIRNGVLPIKLRICTYTKKDRYTHVLDPLSNIQIPHPLHKIPYSQRELRPALEYMKFDSVLANVDLPPLMKNILEFIFECGETTVADVAHRFGVKNRVAKNNLESLISKELLKKRKEMYYDISLERIDRLASRLF